MQDSLTPIPRASILRTSMLAVVTAIASTACVDAAAPTDSPLDAVSADPDAVHARAALIGIDDALLRILPLLDDAEATAPLRATLTDLSSVIATGERTERQSAAAATALRALDAMTGYVGADEAELDAIRLAVDAAAWQRAVR